MTMALAIALVACPAATPKAGDKGDPGDPAKQPPYVALAITDVSVVQGMSKTVDLSKAFRDPEKKALAFDAESGDETKAKAAVAGTTLTVTGVGVGTTSIVVTATDPDGLSVGQSFEVTVTEAPPEPEPPVTIGDVPATLTITPTTAADVSTEVELPADHSLRSGDTDVVTVARKAAEASTPASSIQWASATADTAENVWVVTAVSEGVASVYVLDASKAIAKTITVSVTADPPAPTPDPVAPVVTAIDDQTLYKDDGAQTIDLSMHFTHDNEITYAASASPAGVVTVAVSDDGTLTLTPRVTGQAIVTVTATADGESVTDEFTVDVVAGSKPEPPAPVAPTKVKPIEAQTIYQADGAEEIDLSEHFSHDNEITYTAEVRGDAVDATIAGSMLTLDPVLTGQARVTVTATADGESSSYGFLVTVEAGSEPVEPVEPDPEPMDPVAVGTIAAMTLTVGGDAGTREVAGNFSDEDSETLTYSAESDKTAVATASVSAGTSTVTVTPVGVGTATITVTAKDEGDRKAIQTFDVTVKAASQVLKINETVIVSVKGATTAEPDKDGIVEVTELTAPRWQIEGKKQGSVKVLFYDADSTLLKTIMVEVVNRPPTVDADNLPLSALSIFLVNDNAAEFGANSGVDGKVYRVGANTKAAATKFSSFFKEEDGDSLTYSIGIHPSDSNYAVVAAYYKDASAVYVDIIEAPLSLPEVRILVSVDDGNGGKSGPVEIPIKMPLDIASVSYMAEQRQDGGVRDLAVEYRPGATHTITDLDDGGGTDLDSVVELPKDSAQITGIKLLASVTGSVIKLIADTTAGQLSFETKRIGRTTVRVTQYKAEGTGAAAKWVKDSVESNNLQFVVVVSRVTEKPVKL